MEIEFSFDSECRIDDKIIFPISYWLKTEFSEADQSYIFDKIGDWSFFKSYEKTGMDKLEFLEFIEKSFKAKRDKHIFDQAVDKLINIAPKDFGCDSELYAKDEMYRAWFARRENFLKNYKDGLEVSSREYFYWWPIVDNRTPDSCRRLDGAIFKKGDERLSSIVEQHWNKVNSGCRCGIRLMTERSVKGHLEDKRGYLY